MLGLQVAEQRTLLVARIELRVAAGSNQRLFLRRLLRHPWVVLRRQALVLWPSLALPLQGQVGGSVTLTDLFVDDGRSAEPLDHTPMNLLIDGDHHALFLFSPEPGFDQRRFREQRSAIGRE